MPAVLANSIPTLDPTLGMAVLVRLSGPTTRPGFEVLECDHQLFAEQQQGISEHRASEYTSLALPADSA